MAAVSFPCPNGAVGYGCRWAGRERDGDPKASVSFGMRFVAALKTTGTVFDWKNMPERIHPAPRDLLVICDLARQRSGYDFPCRS